MLKKAILLSIACCFIANTVFAKSISARTTSADKQHEPELASSLQDNGQALGSKAAVATANPLATKAAMEILKKGGNAVDAAITAMLVLGVVEPQASGLGGGGFALVYDNNKKTIKVFDGREISPAAIKEDVFMKDGKPMLFDEIVHSGSSVGVPGFIAMAKKMHAKHGRLPWNALFKEAIHLAEAGFEMPERLAIHLSGFIDEIKRISNEDTINDWYMYLDRKNNAKKQGDKIVNSDLAITLKRLSLSDSVDYFYKGALAKHIQQKVANSKFYPGSLTEDDLSKYEAIETDPICINYRDKYKICTANLPSTGVTVLQAMKLLEKYDLKELYNKDIASFMNVCLEALKLSFADRNAFLADSNFIKSDIVTKLLESNYINSRSRLIKLDEARPTYQAGYGGGLNKDYGKSNTTTHISVIDEFGNAVSFTNSVENSFGSMLMVDGFILNNTMTDFNFDPKFNDIPAANRPQPLKRPRSSMSPIIVFDNADNSIKAIVGSPGGARIISYVFKNLIFLLDLELDPQSISKLPNFATMNSGNIEIEKRTQRSMLSIAKSLEKYGQTVSFDNDLTSGVNMISVNTVCQKNESKIVKTPNLQTKNCPLQIQAYGDFRRGALALAY